MVATASPSEAHVRDGVVDTSNFPSTMPRRIFLDSGGVINDNDLRAPQWAQLIGEYMPTTILGGPSHLWSESNRILAKELFENGQIEVLLNQSKNYNDLERIYNLHWIRESTRIINQRLVAEFEATTATKADQDGKSELLDASVTVTTTGTQRLVQLPESEDDQFRIARDVHHYCTSRVRADFPGVVKAIEELKFEQGFEMFTCSAESSDELGLTFRSLGLCEIGREKECMDRLVPGVATSLLPEYKGPQIKPVFTTLYGPDLVNCVKNSKKFYEQIFKAVGVLEPWVEAVVVDDKEYILGWAKSVGARTVLISTKDRVGKELMVQVPKDWAKAKKAAVTDVALGELEDVEMELVPAVDHQLSSLAELPQLTKAWKQRIEEAAKQ